MKKTYIEPQIEIVAISTSQIICTSSLSTGGDTSSGGITDGDSPEFILDMDLNGIDF